MSGARASLLTPTFTMRVAVRVMVLTILGTAAFLVVRFPELPSLLPVHFRPSGVPNGWQYRTLPRVLMPVFVQLALALSLGAIGALLLSRKPGSADQNGPDARAAAAAAEAVILIGLIWVAFQAYAAVALTEMWSREHGGLGAWYAYWQLVGVIMTGLVATRAHARLPRPISKPDVPGHWRLGQLYCNPDDPALFVPTRTGARWTLNFGRPVAVTLLALILLFGIVGPTAILVLALR
jgi:uncharacterized membrane protein